LNGHKYIYIGDECREAGPGDIFFLNRGKHYIEDTPDGRKPFDQIIFFYSPQELARIISQLNVNHRIDVRVHHSCDECCGHDHVITSGWDALKHFFNATNQHLRDGLFAQDHTAEMLKLTELVYHIISQPECCLRTAVLSSTDSEKEYFEKSAHEYVFSDITLEELAHLNNRSLTTFKKMFKDHFNDPPHRWVIRQRLTHSRLLLISTNKSIAQIGTECRFPNTSHFIKLFHKEFGMTPAAYRRNYSSDVARRAAQRSPVLTPGS
jgi:AraC-like DNA-binding protein